MRREGTLTSVALESCRRLVLCSALGLLAFAAGSNAGAAGKPFSFGVQGDWDSEMGFRAGARVVVNLGGLLRGAEALTPFDDLFPGVISGDADEAGSHLVAGLLVGGGRARPFIECTAQLEGGQQLVVTAGVRF